MKDKFYIFVFMFIITSLFGGSVAYLHSSLASQINSNKLAQNQKVILRMLEILPNKDNFTNDQINEVFKTNISSLEFNINGSIEKVYKRKANSNNNEAGKENILVFEFRGQGFWDKIEGFISINLHQRNIMELYFTKHNETPGLGGRISEETFLNRFKGKKIDLPKIGNKRLVFVSEGSARNENEIDGITGASETTKSVERIINNTLEKIVYILDKFGNQLL